MDNTVAEIAGSFEGTPKQQMDALEALTDVNAFSEKWRHLAELHAAPSWLWRALVAKLIADDWTVETADPLNDVFATCDKNQC
jgi:hypothetical protein